MRGVRDAGGRGRRLAPRRADGPDPRRAQHPHPAGRHRPTPSSRSARSPRPGPRPWSPSSSPRAGCRSTRRSPRCCRACGSASTTRPALVTVRHLLTHSSGLDGDVFTDTGRGDDCVGATSTSLADVATVHPLGSGYSYCNTGFVLLGRMVEVLDGRTWDASLRARIVDPLGLADVCTLPEEALLRPAAVGHDDGAPVPVWGLPRSLGPAGLVCTTAHDLLDLRPAVAGRRRARPPRRDDRAPPRGARGQRRRDRRPRVARRLLGRAPRHRPQRRHHRPERAAAGRARPRPRRLRAGRLAEGRRAPPRRGAGGRRRADRGRRPGAARAGRGTRARRRTTPLRDLRAPRHALRRRARGRRAERRADA